MAGIEFRWTGQAPCHTNLSSTLLMSPTSSVLSSRVSELVFPHLSRRDKHLWEEMVAGVGLYSSHICRSPRGLEGMSERLASGRICLATACNNSADLRSWIPSRVSTERAIRPACLSAAL